VRATSNHGDREAAERTHAAAPIAGYGGRPRSSRCVPRPQSCGPARVRTGAHRCCEGQRSTIGPRPHRLSSGVAAVWPGRTLIDWLSCRMARSNFLIEGVSGTGKTSVCKELQLRGYHAIHGDRELAYQGDAETGEPTDGFAHEHHIWYADRVRAFVANQDEAVAFFCDGSRNFARL
jgi:hypothetical protein